MTSAPVKSEVVVGRASQMNTTAKANPSGTRIRRATRDQVLTLGGGYEAPGCGAVLMSGSQ